MIQISAREFEPNISSLAGVGVAVDSLGQCHHGATSSTVPSLLRNVSRLSCLSRPCLKSVHDVDNETVTKFAGWAAMSRTTNMYTGLPRIEQPALATPMGTMMFGDTSPAIPMGCRSSRICTIGTLGRERQTPRWIVASSLPLATQSLPNNCVPDPGCSPRYGVLLFPERRTASCSIWLGYRAMDGPKTILTEGDPPAHPNDLHVWPGGTRPL